MNRLNDALSLVVQGIRPSVQQMRLAFEDALEPGASPVGVAAWLTAMRLRGEDADMLEAVLAAVMDRMTPFGDADTFGPIRLDTCGTGGDHASTLNVSTAAALVCAAAGVTVIKHGNRAATGRSGSSQVLESLGVRLDLPLSALHEALHRFRFAFLFAPAFHPALKSLAPIRSALPFRTVFNLVGPLANPARPTHQLLGVADAALGDLFAKVLQARGIVSAAVVSGQDGLDEVSLGAPTRVLVVSQDSIEEHLWHPELTFGLPMYPPGLIRVDSPEESARRLRAVFDGRPEHPADEAYVVANAAAALWLAEKADSPSSGVELARSVLADGSVTRLLDDYARFSGAATSPVA